MHIKLLGKRYNERTVVAEEFESDNVLEVFWSLGNKLDLDANYYLQANSITVPISRSSFLSSRLYSDTAPAKEENLKLLDRICDLLDAGWTQGSYARRMGVGLLLDVAIEHKEACRYCLFGAVIRASYELFIPPLVVEDLLNVTTDELYHSTSAISWQDKPDRKFEEVKTLLGKVREKLLSS